MIAFKLFLLLSCLAATMGYLSNIAPLKFQQRVLIARESQSNEKQVYPTSEIDKAISATNFLFKSFMRLATLATIGVAAPALAETTVKKAKKPKVLETDLGIKYIELKKGSGAFPATGDFVVINYSAFLKNGTMYDTTEVKGRKPLTFRFGEKQVIPGLESVISYMQPGGEATMQIPAKFAYGSKGVCIQGEGCLVPPDEDLKYAVKLLRVGAGYN